MRDAWKYQRPAPRNLIPDALVELADQAADEEAVNWQKYYADELDELYNDLGGEG